MSLRCCTTLFFNLNRRVSDLEIMSHAFSHCRQHIVVHRAIGHHGMHAHRVDSRSQRPDMQIMNPSDAFDSADRFAQRCQVDIRRRAFEQHADCLAQQRPGARKNEQPDAR